MANTEIADKLRAVWPPHNDLAMAAAVVDDAFFNFHRAPTEANLKTLVGVWARANRLLIKAEAPIGPMVA